MPGDLILSNSATPGIPKFMGIEACIHDGWLLLREFDHLDKNFCYYLLKYERPRLLQKGSGSVFTNLKTDILRTHRVRIPLLPEQRAIASILGALDDKIDLNRRMNETLEAMARAIFKSWFVDFDPVRAKAEGKQPFGMDAETAALFPDRLVDSELGPIPEGWEVGTIAEDFNLVMGQSPPGETYNEDGAGVPFFQGKRDFGTRFPSRRVFCTAPTRHAIANSTLLSVRAPVGTVNQAWEDCAIGRGLASLMHKENLAEFTYQVGLNLQDEFEVYDGDGTVFGSINKGELSKLKVIRPNGVVRSGYECKITSASRQLRLNTEESRTLAELRDLLLSKLLSGEIRVKDAEKMVGDAV